MSLSLTSHLLDELKALQKAGMRGVYVSDANWERLCQQVAVVKRKPSALSPSSSASALANKALPVVSPVPVVAALPPSIKLPEGTKAERHAYLQNFVLNTHACKAQAGKSLVFGSGSLDAPIVFCGEAPGEEEETAEEPFVGPAGQLLTKIIQAMGLSRDQVYLTNIMKWRLEAPAGVGSRPPTPEEMGFSLPYLQAQIAIVQPKVVVALGASAVGGVLGPDFKRKMAEVRGKWHLFDNYPLMVTYHPSYLIHNATQRAKRQVWEDMLLVMEKLNLPISDKQRAFFS